ncbi:Uma2 family endonuclease [Sphingomonas sp. BK235]|uniref:Uma2 family endonuclease n=1 Tax=Sphingomonas sp. BK235 TaxID=2512131 RepID=UPI00104CF6B1|nr:Uma2 family endonuclease [Sphingomonas sp. BK235]TCP34115.1 Uma2 family endonuclease [Sphingomonas sp. BK235]
MATDAYYQPITADQFLAMDFGTDRKFELSNGVIQMMTGGTELHAWVQGNLVAWLRQALRGSGCRSYGSEMGVRVGEHDVRYPDVSIHCGKRPDHGENVRALDRPVVIIEVLSPSTATFDQGTKLEEYRSIDSVLQIVFVDPINQLIRTHRRLATGNWLISDYAATGIELPMLGITIPQEEIFARD